MIRPARSANWKAVVPFLQKRKQQKGRPSAVVDSLHLWPEGPGFESASLLNFKRILQG